MTKLLLNIKRVTTALAQQITRNCLSETVDTARLPNRNQISGLVAEFLFAKNQPKNIRLAEIKAEYQPEKIWLDRVSC